MNIANMPVKHDKVQAGATSTASTPVQPLPDFRECTKWPAGLVRCVANSGHGRRIKRQGHSSNKSSSTRRQRKLYSRSNKDGFVASVTTCLVIACRAHAAAHIKKKWQLAICDYSIVAWSEGFSRLKLQPGACAKLHMKVHPWMPLLGCWTRKKKNDEQG